MGLRGSSDMGTGRVYTSCPATQPGWKNPPAHERFGVTHMIRGLFVLLAALLVSPAPAESLAGKKPNIILVMTDDQGMGDLVLPGQPGSQDAEPRSILRTVDTVHRLSRQSHLCPDSFGDLERSARVPQRRDAHDQGTGADGARPRPRLPKLLQKAGYETGIFGKWHLGDEDAYQPYNRGFSEVFIHGAGGIGQSYEGSCADFPPNRTRTSTSTT